jgi:hypothetical protein
MLSGPIAYADTGAARILDPYSASSAVVAKEHRTPGHWARCAGLVHVGRNILAQEVGLRGTAVPVGCYATAVAGRPQSVWVAMRPQSQAGRQY